MTHANNNWIRQTKTKRCVYVMKYQVNNTYHRATEFFLNRLPLKFTALKPKMCTANYKWLNLFQQCKGVWNATVTHLQPFPYWMFRPLISVTTHNWIPLLKLKSWVKFFWLERTVHYFAFVLLLINQYTFCINVCFAHWTRKEVISID